MAFKINYTNIIVLSGLEFWYYLIISFEVGNSGLR